MNISIKLSSILLFIAAVSCSKPVADATYDSLNVSVPTDTKVHINGLKTYWDKGDALTVFYMSESAEKWIFCGRTGDTSGQISHEATSRTVTGSYIHAIYPYDSKATMENGVIHTEIPSEQQYRKDSYGTAILACRADFDILALKYCTAVVELKYYGPAEISHIELSGNKSEKICGASTISFEEQRPKLTCKGSSSVVLNCNVSVPDTQTESFYFSIAPGTFSSGISFTIYFKQGGSQKVTISEKVSLDAGHIYTVTGSSPNMPYDQKIINLLFSDGTQRYQPFTTEMTFKYGTEQGPFYYQIGEDKYPFYTLCQNDTGDKNFRITNGGGLYIGGTDGDYIKFPAIKGYRLQDIAVSIHKSASDFHIVPTDDPDQAVTGGRCTAAESGDFRMLYLSDTKENTSYSMMLDKVCCFRFISLYYRK